MATTTTTATEPGDGQYRLLAWMSPAFPVGGFSYSHGLEFAVEVGAAANREDVQAFIVTALEREHAAQRR